MLPLPASRLITTRRAFLRPWRESRLMIYSPVAIPRTSDPSRSASDDLPYFGVAPDGSMAV
jgi:hypothetical protein